MVALNISDFSDISREHKDAGEAVQRAITLLEEVIFDASAWRRRNKGSAETYLLRRDLPYCLHATESGGVQIVVNRNYKPVGSNQPTGGKFMKYEDFSNLHTRLSSQQILSFAENARGYLFEDDTAPWLGAKEARNYLNRLRRLLKILNS